MTTDMTEPPRADAPPADDWFATVPKDWTSWLAWRARADASRTARRNLLDHVAAHVREDEHLKRGLGAYAGGQMLQAAEELAHCDEPLARALLGRLQRRAGDHDAALATWESVKTSPAVGTRVVLWILETLAHLGRLEALDAALESVRRAGASAADVAYADGLVAETRGDHEGAMASWHLAMQHDPSHADAAFHLAYRADLDGDDELAIEHYAKFVNGALPPRVGALMNLGILHEDRGEDSEARRCFRAVVDADPMNVRARRYLVDAEASMHQFYDEDREKRSEQSNAVLRIPVTDFELSVRARNCLLKMQIHTLGDLIRHTEQELLSFKNFGETSLQEIKDILAIKNLRLGMSPTDGGRSRPLPPVDPDDVMAKPISELDLSVRSRSALSTLGIKTLGDLASTSEATLLACRNFGQTSLTEIKQKLADHNLTLAGK